MTSKDLIETRNRLINEARARFNSNVTKIDSLREINKNLKKYILKLEELNQLEVDA